jgi:phosphatidylserine synthase
MKTKSRNIGNKSIYFLTRPILILAMKMNISPNSITTLSLFFSISSLLTVILVQNLIIFIFCNIVSVLLDYVDGPLARLMNQTRKSEFRYDHYSDLIKIAIFVISITIIYNDKLVDFLSHIFIILFLLFTIINHDHNFKINIKQVGAQLKPRLTKKRHHFIILITEFDGPMYLLLILSSINRNLLLFIFIYISILFAIYIVRLSLDLLKLRIV